MGILMKKSSLVSVVVPIHNRPAFLRRTLQSILEQTYQNSHVIVVSNGFNCDNKKTVDDLQDSGIEYYEQENAGGLASSRNHGIKESRLLNYIKPALFNIKNRVKAILYLTLKRL